MSHTVRIFKLINDEIIIGIIENKEFENVDTSEDEDLSFSAFCFNVHFPFKMNTTYNRDNGSHEIFFEDWIPYSRNTFTSIMKDKILMMTEPSNDVFQLYESKQSQLELDVFQNKSNTKASKKKKRKSEFENILKSLTFSDDDVQ
jgi:hypothetical protein